MFQCFDAFHVGGIFKRVAFVEFDHHIEIVEASELAAEHVHKPCDERNFFAHRFCVIHVYVNVHHARNLQQHYGGGNCGDDAAVPANFATEKFKENVGLGGACRFHLRWVGLCIFTEAHENRNQDDDV